MRMRFRRSVTLSMFILLWAIVFLAGIDRASCDVVTDEIFSPALAGNLLGDPDTRPVTIYLPPGYNAGDTRYPVIYYLHGYTGNDKDWVNLGIHSVMDDLIEQGEVQEMIIVMPNAHSKYDGSWYANSSVAGNYEDYITQDLVEFIDSKYRTLPQRESRAIAGGSMGGLGAMYLAIMYPDVYCAVVSHSGVLSLERYKSLVRSNPSYIAFRAMALAFSPNPDVALLYDSPTGQLFDDVWSRWLEHDPATLVETHQDNLKQLAGIYFEHGTIDSTVPVSMARDFDQALTQAGIPHVYQEYVGEHTDHWRSNLYITLPFLSDLLNSNILTSVRVGYRLAVTWASLRAKTR